MAEHDFQKVLDVSPVSEGDGEHEFSATPIGDGGHLYGGHSLGLAFRAATKTVNPELWPQSLHANFIDAGTAGGHMRLKVQSLRDSRAFAVRQITATQGDAMPLLMQASFHAGESGPDWRAVEPFDFPEPESLESHQTSLFNMDPMDVRPIHGPSNREPDQMVTRVHPFWVRPRMELPDDRMLHASVVAFLSDYLVVSTAQAPGTKVPMGSRVVTMEHGLWFLRPIDANDWLLFTAEAMSVYHGRGLSRGSVFNREGLLLATFVQEVLTRLPRA